MTIEADVDRLITVAVVEHLLYPEMSGDRIGGIAGELGLELTEAQEDYAIEAVLRTLDQLAIPFVDSLPAEMSQRYREDLEIRARESYPLSGDAPEV